MLVEFAEEEKEEDGVEVPEFGVGRRGGGGGVLHEVFEKSEIGEEMAGNEEGLVVEGDGL